MIDRFWSGVSIGFDWALNFLAMIAMRLIQAFCGLIGHKIVKTGFGVICQNCLRKF